MSTFSESKTYQPPYDSSLWLGRTDFNKTGLLNVVDGWWLFWIRLSTILFLVTFVVSVVIVAYGMFSGFFRRSGGYGGYKNAVM